MSFTGRKSRTKSAERRFVPKPYQKECIRFGVSRPSAGFFLAPGLGKTAIILFIFKILKSLGVVDELFVLAKRRIVYSVWRKEIRKWNLPFKAVVVHGPHKTEALYDESACVRLMNYEGLPWLASKQNKIFFRRGKKIMLACDESSKLKNAKTARFRTLKKILKFFVRRYILTGSPAPNGLMNIFSQILVLDDGAALGRYITHFRNQYFRPTGFMGHDWELLEGAEKRMFKAIKHLVVRYGHDQLDLPPITFINRWVKLPSKARKVYDEVEKEFVYQWHDGEIDAANAAVASGKLRQIANGGVFLTDKKDEKKWKWVHDAKCEELCDLLEELNGEPALIAFEFKHDIERFRRYARKHAPQFAKAPYIAGGVSDKEASRYESLWEDGKLPVLFGHPDSVAHGLNLQGKGGIVIYFALTWNLENDEQFYQRVWRQGQKRRVLVYRIVARGTVDEIMLAALKYKDRTQQSLLKAMERKYGLR